MGVPTGRWQGCILEEIQKLGVCVILESKEVKEVSFCTMRVAYLRKVVCGMILSTCLYLATPKPYLKGAQLSGMELSFLGIPTAPSHVLRRATEDPPSSLH